MNSLKHGNPARPLIVKLGGSLFDLPDLFDRLEYLADRLEETIWLVPGGGGFAEELRRLDRIHHWPQEASHALALQTMSLTAQMLVRSHPGLKLGGGLAEGGKTSDSHEPDSREILVVDVTRIPEIEKLPASWDVTSDSIAAWLSLQQGSGRLLLLKSTDLPEPVPTFEQAAQQGLVDDHFPHLASMLSEIQWANLRSPQVRIRTWGHGAIKPT